jgi:hypothetical protein
MAEPPLREPEPDVSHGLELATKAIQELEPAVQEFADATGLLEPIRELTTWLAESIRYRRAPYKAKLLMSAAKKVRATGIPPRAVSDRLLRAVLEDGALEDDPAMQDHWANLLAHEATVGRVPPSYPEILRQLEPIEARTLDVLVVRGGLDMVPIQELDLRGHVGMEDLEWRHLDNLERLQLISYRIAGPVNVKFAERPAEESTMALETPLGVARVAACRDPSLQPDIELPPASTPAT